MISQKGFTLIETLVAGIVSLVIPGVLIAILTVSNKQIDDDATSMRASQIATAVSEDLVRAGRSATWVYGRVQAGVTDTDCPGTDPTDVVGLSGIAFCDQARTVIKAYRIGETFGDRGVLDEYDPGKGWRPMAFAGDTVKLTLDPSDLTIGQSPREGGLFGLGKTGTWSWFNFHFDMEVGGKRVSLPLQMQSVVCRNAPSRMALGPW